MAVMTAVVIAIAMGGGILLMLTGIGHTRRFGHLRATLISQALLPYRWHRPLAHMLVAAELVLGFAALVAVPASLDDQATIVFTAEAGLYLVLLAYAVVLRASRPAAPCGCFGGDGPVTLPALARTGVLALGSCAAAALTAFPITHTVTPLVLFALGAVVIAVVAYAAPIAFLRTPNHEELTWKP